MINIELEEIGNRFYVSLLGHANYAEHNKDIVCAGVSTLALSFIYYVKDLQEAGEAEIIADTEQEGAILFICDVADIRDIKPAFKMLRSGLGSIAVTYPEYVYLCGLETQKQ